MAASRKLQRQPERLALAAAPTTLRIDVQHSKGHGAQLPLSRRAPQVSSRPTVAWTST
jgi:hypothetical protein